MSIALEIARIAEVQLGAAASTLVGVGVAVGDHAGVEPANLEFCLEAVFSTPPFRAARPTILPAPGDTLQLQYLEVDDDGPDD